jgi:serine 3-dehydrogenase
VEPGLAETEFSEVRFKGDRERAKTVYEGLRALTADDVAEAVVWCLTRPAHVNVQSVLIMPTDQASAHAVNRRK